MFGHFGPHLSNDPILLEKLKANLYESYKDRSGLKINLMTITN